MIIQGGRFSGKTVDLSSSMNSKTGKLDEGDRIIVYLMHPPSRDGNTESVVENDKPVADYYIYTGGRLVADTKSHDAIKNGRLTVKDYIMRDMPATLFVI